MVAPVQNAPRAERWNGTHIIGPYQLREFKKKVRQKAGSLSHSVENLISLFDETMTVLTTTTDNQP
jgi:hypothetical protein